jgi:tetratricopeptide (TPR) repeat protein
MENARELYHAHLLVEQGQKKLHPGCWESLCSSRDERLESAKQCYERAGNQFKLEKNWFQAGECFEKCAEIEEQLKADPSSYFEEAAHCFKFEDKKRAKENLDKCVILFEKNGRFNSAGDAKKKLASDYEAENDYANAILEYKKASDYYEMEKSNSKSNHNICLIKAADLMCISDHKDAFEESKNVYHLITLDL